MTLRSPASGEGGGFVRFGHFLEVRGEFVRDFFLGAEEMGALFQFVNGGGSGGFIEGPVKKLGMSKDVCVSDVDISL